MYDSFKRGSLLLLAYLFKLINQQWPETSNTWYNARDPFGIRVDQSDRSSTLTKWAINICGGYGFVWFSKISLLSLTPVTVIFHACFRQAFGIITEQPRYDTIPCYDWQIVTSLLDFIWYVTFIGSKFNSSLYPCTSFGIIVLFINRFTCLSALLDVF
jgi:hypothetical protein